MNNKKGFSILEVLVAISILVIIVFTFTTLFSAGFSGIFSAGRKSEALYKVQKEMENAIINKSGNNVTDGTISISFPSLTDPITVTGKFVICDQTYTDSNGNERTVTITSFVPNQ
ncbi:prepilin-type N-terminal cleavage/methylation domain-containing protein [Desulfallas sp. Bu1-1]|uniref:type IV pilus modification PilV family protein n=1 Tax=Desulfallas sp. Bu1-1 TaxID=2787620 RepID=UPI0018A04C90|nr:prepilin-type N-terminal cleavage/methylation domain-containing protein [Desulfallas sp. Bu1-1]MBF7082134.1 prepilin-type N-terminal cleavage/methylation domain-containing protein [Desulfallas sp. Bu1-1]